MVLAGQFGQRPAIAQRINVQLHLTSETEMGLFNIWYLN